MLCLLFLLFCSWCCLLPDLPCGSRGPCHGAPEPGMYLLISLFSQCYDFCYQKQEKGKTLFLKFRISIERNYTYFLMPYDILKISNFSVKGYKSWNLGVIRKYLRMFCLDVQETQTESLWEVPFVTVSIIQLNPSAGSSGEVRGSVMICTKAQRTRTLLSIPRQGIVPWRGETCLWDLGWLTCLWGFGVLHQCLGWPSELTLNLCRIDQLSVYVTWRMGDRAWSILRGVQASWNMWWSNLCG